MVRLHLLGSAVIVTFVLGACGGSSTSDSGSGGQGQGGSGGGGGAGATTGTGGIGGSGGAGGGVIPTSDIEKLCAQIDTLPCKVPDCVEQAIESAADAGGDGCGAEFLAVIDCALAHPMLCVAGKAGPQFDFACTDALDALDACFGASCSAGGDGTSCEVSCDVPQPYGAKCTPIGADSLSCTCTQGPSVGKGYTALGSCSDFTGIQEAAKAQCSD